MSNLVLQLLPFVLLIVIFVLIFTRKGEIDRTKSIRLDWITFFAVILASTVIASAMTALGAKLPPWLIGLPPLFLLILLVVALRRARTGRPILQRKWDERTEVIYAKSARNALFATYLAFFVHLLITDADTLDTAWLLITLGGGLFVLIGSTFFYYYRKS